MPSKNSNSIQPDTRDLDYVLTRLPAVKVSEAFRLTPANWHKASGAKAVRIAA